MVCIRVLKILYHKMKNIVTERKELDDLVSALGGKKLKLCKSCMEGTRSDILQAIETEVKNTTATI